MSPYRELRACLIGPLAWVLWVAPSVAQEPLTLRVNDAVAAPGELMAVVLRTYTPRGLTQGQICLGGGGGQPLAEGAAVLETLVDYEVFGDPGDVTAEVVHNPELGTTDLVFSSPSGSVNREDGPLAVLYFRVAGSAAPGTALEWSVDVQASSLEDETAQNVPIDARSGTLEVVAASAPLELGVDDGTALPGDAALLTVSTDRSFPLNHGELHLNFGPSLPDSSAEIEAWVDPRYGDVSTEVTVTAPGQIRLVFQAADLSFNRLPGEIFHLSLPMAPDVPVGSEWLIGLGPESFVADNDGGQPALDLDVGLLTIVAPPPIFEDGFESGDTGAWSSTQP